MIVESTGAAFIKLGPLPGPRYCKVCGLLEASMISRATIRNDDTKNSMGIVAAASAIGTTIEWYDFLIYATAASLVLNKLFFRTRTLLSGSCCRSAQLALVSS